MKYLLDCDGVLCDFVSGALAAHGRSHDGHDSVRSWNFFESWGISALEFYDKIAGYDFWFNLKPYDWAALLVDEIGFDNFVISTAPTMDPTCVEAKLDWLFHHFKIPMSNVMIGSRKELMAKSGLVLIDDSPKNVEKFREHGGNALLFPQPWNGGDERKRIEFFTLLAG